MENSLKIVYRTITRGVGMNGFSENGSRYLDFSRSELNSKGFYFPYDVPESFRLISYRIGEGREDKVKVPIGVQMPVFSDERVESYHLVGEYAPKDEELIDKLTLDIEDSKETPGLSWRLAINPNLANKDSINKSQRIVDAFEKTLRIIEETYFRKERRIKFST